MSKDGKKANGASTDHGIRDRADAAKAAANDVYEAARERFSTAGEKIASSAKAAGSEIGGNPALALAGGLALGVIAGALLPRTSKEDEMLGGLGARARQAGLAALAAGREAGEAKVDELGFNKDTARDQVQKFFAGLGDVASTAGQAAVQAARDGKRG